jgi:hypothetical protein
MKPFPVGVAQGMVLKALGVKGIETHADADAYFRSIGIAVLPVRHGRHVVPQVYKLNGIPGWSREGDVEPAFPNYPDWSLIEQYMEKEEV